MNPRTDKPIVKERTMQVPERLARVLHTRGEQQAHYWIEAPLGDSWVAAYRLIVRDGRPMIAELRIFPAEGPIGEYTPAPGEWTGTWLAAVPVPDRGITAGLIRKQVDPSLPIALINELRKKMQDLSLAYWNDGEPTSIETRGRKQLYSDLFYAEVARDYVDAIQRGSRKPAADVAKTRPGLSEAAARAVISRARHRLHFLTPANTGVKGGELTDKAKKLLSAKTKRRGKR